MATALRGEAPVATVEVPTSPDATMGEPGMTDFKEMISRSEYKVDPKLVAEEIVWRLRLVSRLLPALAGEAGRTLEPGASDPCDPGTPR